MALLGVYFPNLFLSLASEILKYMLCILLLLSYFIFFCTSLWSFWEKVLYKSYLRNNYNYYRIKIKPPRHGMEPGTYLPMLHSTDFIFTFTLQSLQIWIVVMYNKVLWVSQKYKSFIYKILRGLFFYQRVTTST